MGYTTSFKGELQFNRDLLGSELAHLNKVLGKDVRDHPEWDAPQSLYHLDLELTEDYSGIKWNGAEKTYGMVDAVNFVIEWMRKVAPDFSLQGELEAQGEEASDRWVLFCDADGAVEAEVKLVKRELTEAVDKFIEAWENDTDIECEGYTLHAFDELKAARQQ